MTKAEQIGTIHPALPKTKLLSAAESFFEVPDTAQPGDEIAGRVNLANNSFEKAIFSITGGTGKTLFTIEDYANSRGKYFGILRLAANEHQPYQLAILDMHMPAMDGITLSHLINADPRIAGMPRVMLSSMCDQIDSSEYEAAEIASYLTKPVRQSELYHCLTAMIGGTNASTASNLDTRADAPPAAAAPVDPFATLLGPSEYAANVEIL